MLHPLLSQVLAAQTQMTAFSHQCFLYFLLKDATLQHGVLSNSPTANSIPNLLAGLRSLMFLPWDTLTERNAAKQDKLPLVQHGCLLSTKHLIPSNLIYVLISTSDAIFTLRQSSAIKQSSKTKHTDLQYSGRRAQRLQHDLFYTHPVMSPANYNRESKTITEPEATKKLGGSQTADLSFPSNRIIMGPESHSYFLLGYISLEIASDKGKATELVTGRYPHFALGTSARKAEWKRAWAHTVRDATRIHGLLNSMWTISTKICSVHQQIM